MTETIISLAKTFLIDLVLDNEEVKKFPKDFVTASMLWIRSWFLEDDPVTKTVVESNTPVVAKEAVLEAKLTELLKNQQFEQELKLKLEEFNTHRNRIKNVVEGGADIQANNIHIGDKGSVDNTHYDMKNIIKPNSTIRARQDFHLGDE